MPESFIAQNYRAICSKVCLKAAEVGREAKEISIVAVTKNQPIDALISLYELGHRSFGESKVQELFCKDAFVPQEVQWHFIGHLQRNKVRKIIGKCALIHSVDSYDLALKISQCSQEMGITTCILLEVNASNEPSKKGLSLKEWQKCYEKTLALKGLCIQGLMTMAPFTTDEHVIRHAFSSVRNLAQDFGLKELSMGMSHDYLIAIEEGATMLRIGTSLFQSKGRLNL